MSIRIKQHDITDCGAACIASIAAYYKLLMPIARIRQLACTSNRGTSIAGLLEALKGLGFDAKGARGDIAALLKVPKPAITHIMPRAGLHHYVVVYGASSTHIELMDPADGKIHHYTHDEFLTVWTGVMVIMLPGEAFRPANNKASTWLRLWRLVRPHRSIMIQAMAGALVFTLIGLSTSIYVQKIVDYVLPDDNYNLLHLMSTVMIALLVIQTFTGISKSIMILQTGQRIDAKLILGYYVHLLRLPQSFFDNMRIGEITSRVNDAMKIRVFINDASVAVAVNFFVVVLSFALMFTYHWRLALVMAAMLPGYALLYAAANTLNRSVERKLMERAADLESQLVESLGAVFTIKSFGMEHYSDHKTESRFIALLQSVYDSGRNSIYTGSAGEFLSRLFTIILLWAGAGFVLDRTITPGELLSFYALAAYFSGPATSLISMNKTVQHALIASDRLFDIMDLETEASGVKTPLTPSMMGDIVFQSVHFRYNASVTVFDDLDLTIERNKVTAIVGESGSGKSTLLSILQHMYPIHKGSVRIGDYDLRYLDLESLRRVISIVPQRIDLFAGTVIENIAVGDDIPDIGKIIAICTSLNMLDFIERLQDGFNSWVGEHGAALSGGQKQRIAIARALYRDPEVLILDEATSSLDAGSEQYVHRMIDVMRQREKTVIIVAHRLSTVFRADKIVVLANGRVAEQGNHDALMRNMDAYYRLWVQQFPAEVRDMITPEMSRK
jgi:ATP-binding cassette subfamily B protein